MKSQQNISVDTYCDANNFFTIFQLMLTGVKHYNMSLKLIGVKHYGKSVLQWGKTQSNLDHKEEVLSFLEKVYYWQSI